MNDVALRQCSSAGVRISSQWRWNFALHCTLLSIQPSLFSVWDWKPKWCLLFGLRLQQQNLLVWCQRKFLHVTNCQEKLAAGEVYLIWTVSKTNTATADIEICCCLHWRAELTNTPSPPPVVKCLARLSSSALVMHENSILMSKCNLLSHPFNVIQWHLKKAIFYPVNFSWRAAQILV